MSLIAMTVLAPPASLLVFPDDPTFDEARAAWNLAVDQRPAAVALPETADDVVAAVRAACAAGQRVAAQGTGHGAGALGDLSDTLLIKTHRMRGVRIDAVNRIARVEAGALWMDVVGPAAEHGLACLHGSAPDVGVVGYTLGGGMSFYGRRYGAASDRVIALDVVMADGTLVRASRREHADLFDALRGGGGAFGVVTAMEFELFAPGPIQAGHLWFPFDRGREVFKAWSRWVAELPDTATATARLIRVPDVDGPPPHLRGKEFALIEVVVLGSAEDAEALVAPMRALGPDMDTLAAMEITGLAHLHMDPPGPTPGIGDHQSFAELGDDAIDAVFDNLGPSVLAYKIHYGGARLASLGGPFIAFGVGMAPTPEIKAVVIADLDRLRAACAPHASDREYLNFAEIHRGQRLWDDATHARLRAVKAAVDPEDLIRSNHPVV